MICSKVHCKAKSFTFKKSCIKCMYPIQAFNKIRGMFCHCWEVGCWMLFLHGLPNANTLKLKVTVNTDNKLWNNHSQQQYMHHKLIRTLKRNVWFPLLKLHTPIYQHNAPNEKQELIITDIDLIACTTGKLLWKIVLIAPDTCLMHS